jgi:hypothetical protein
MRAALAACLHRNSPDFSPEALATLVIRAQTAAESFDGEDQNGIARARLASFASSSRVKTSSVPPPKKKTLGIWIAALGLALSAIVGVTIWIRLDNVVSKPKRQAISAEVPPSHTRPADSDKKPMRQAGPASFAQDTASDIVTDAAQGSVEPSTATEAHVNDTANDKGDVSRKAKVFGQLNINASPWAEIEIDGHDYEGCPLLGVKLSAGKHKAVLKNSELGVTKTQRFTIKPNETTVILVDMESASQ